MPTNDFLPFGSAVGANVSTQAEYVALAARSNGFSAGTAVSKQLNKAWRQSSVMAATLAQFIADQSGNDVLDDGNLALIQTNLGLAIKAAIATGIPYATQAQVNAGTSTTTVVAPRTLSTSIQSQVYTAYAAGGVAPAFTLTPVPAIAAYVLNQRFQVSFGAAGGAAPTLNVSAVGPKNLKQYNSAGTKVAAIIAAGQTGDVFYDGTDFVLLANGMPLGTGGIGSTLNTPTASDTNAALAGGLWSLAGTANSPFAYGMLLRGNYNGSQSWTQIATSIDNAGMFWQGSINGTINPWRQVWDSVSFNPASKVNATNVANAGFSSSSNALNPFMTHNNGTTIGLSTRNTAQLAASGWSKNTDTGEIIQWVEVLIGDFAGSVQKTVTWPFQFPGGFLNAKVNFRDIASNVNIQGAYGSASITGCTIRVDEWSAVTQSASLTAIVEARGF